MDTLHAACVVVSGVGILIRGDSGAGKTTLALLLADAYEGALVADDRVRIEARDGRLLARAHPAEAGRVEIRGQGIRTVAELGLATRDEASLALVIDLVGTAPRMPDPPGDARFLGIALPRLVLDRDVRQAGLAPLLVRAALRKGWA